jgi:hypothetical protein
MKRLVNLVVRSWRRRFLKRSDNAPRQCLCCRFRETQVTDHYGLGRNASVWPGHYAVGGQNYSNDIGRYAIGFNGIGENYGGTNFVNDSSSLRFVGSHSTLPPKVSEGS